MAFTSTPQSGRSDWLDAFWRDGMLLDTTYLRALVVDGVTPEEATKRLNALKAAKGHPVLPVGLQPEYRR